MNHPSISRRTALRALGGAFLGAALGGGPAPRPAPAQDRPKPPTVVDAHIHIAHPRLPGVRAQPTPLAPFGKEDPEGMKQLVKRLEDQIAQAQLTHALCMPRFEVSDRDPLGIQDTLAVADQVRGAKLHPIGLVHPERFDPDHLDRVGGVLKEGKVKGLKVYLGYLHYPPDHPGYRRYYALAAKHNTPVILHCGDTYSDSAKVKYAHPLKLDEVAVDFPDTRFVLAHFGNPWVMDAAQVVYKNKNVWADLSAVLIGTADEFTAMKENGVAARTANRIKEGIEYSEAPERFIFGSDWPLSPIAVYRDFVRELFPEKHHAAVFGGTATNLFRL